MRNILIFISLLCLLVIGIGGRLSTQHGLTRTLYSSDTPTRSDLWGWLAFDGADYRDEDVANRVDEVRFKGYIWQPEPSIWRIAHTGGVDFTINSESVLQIDTRQPLTYTELPVERGWLDIEATYQSGLAEYDVDGRHIEFGVYENGQLLDSHHLYPESVSPDLIQRETLIYIITRVALFIAVLSFALLVVLLLPLRSSTVWLTLALIFLAWLIRYVVLYQRSLDDPFFYYLVPGSDNYVLMARETLMGSSHLTGAFFSPGNTIWMIVLTTLFGTNLWALYLVNITVGALSIGAISGLGREIGGKWTGITAGLIAALFPLLIFYHTTLQLEAFLSALLPLSLWLGVQALKQPHILGNAIFGFSIGWITLLRMTSAVVGIVYALALLFNSSLTIRKRIILLSTTAFFSLLTILPQTLANLSVGEIALVNTNGPDTFYWGINRDGNGADVVGEAWYLTRIRRQTFAQAALEDLREQPLRAVELTLHKFGLLLSNTDIANNVDYAAQGLESSPLLNTLSLQGLWGATIMLLFGFIGVGLLMTEETVPKKIRVLLVASFGLFTLATLTFTIFGRMRAPLWVMFSVFTAFAITYILRYRLTRKLIVITLIALMVLGSARYFKGALPRKPFFNGDLPVIYTPVNIQDDQEVQLIGWQIIEERCPPDGYLFLSLIWEASESHMEDQTAAIELLDPEGDVVAKRETRIGTVSYPSVGTSRWKPGARLEERYLLVIPEQPIEDLELHVNTVNLATVKTCKN